MRAVAGHVGDVVPDVIDARQESFPASYGRIDDLLGPATGRFSRRQPAGRNASRAE